MKAKRILIIILVAICLQPSIAQHKPGAFTGVVSDLENMETIPLAHIVIKDASGTIIAGGSSDFDGEFNINPITPGLYTVEASFIGYEKEIFKQVEIYGDKETKFDILLTGGSYELIECVIIEELPLLDRTRSCRIGCGYTTGVINVMGDVEIDDQPFALFPNPSTGELNLKADSEINKVLITNMNGQTVAEISVDNPNDISANLSHLPASTYIVHFSDGISRKSQLWILQH